MNDPEGRTPADKSSAAYLISGCGSVGALKLGRTIPASSSHTPVMIVGHTDSKGSDDYNQSLSERRAVSVQRWLTDSQVTSRITTMDKGQSVPVASNENADGTDKREGRQKNRRVEFIIGD